MNYNDGYTMLAKYNSFFINKQEHDHTMVTFTNCKQTQVTKI